jgi:tetratricopeptide (TPR) repeat protein
VRAVVAHHAMGLAHEALRQPERARAAWKRAADDFAAQFGDRAPGAGEARAAHFAAARAFERLGDKTRASEIDRALIRAGEERLGATERTDFFAKFGEQRSQGAHRAEAHLLIGLGHLGLGESAAARQAFEQAAALDVGNVWAEHYRVSLR